MATSLIETEGILNGTNNTDNLLLNIPQDEEGNNKLLKSSIFQYILDATNLLLNLQRLKLNNAITQLR